MTGPPDHLATTPAPLLLALDYDGTLVEFVADPAAAAPDAPLLHLLHALAARPDTTLRIVSGRPWRDLDRFLGTLDAGLSAEHGLWWRAPSGKWHTTRPIDLRGLDEVRRVFEAALAAVPGSTMETKTAGFAFHTRAADRTRAAAYRPGLLATLHTLTPPHGLQVLEQHELLEVRVAGIDKGLALQGPWAPAPGVTLVAIGDDRTDEDLFAAAPPGSVTVRVGDGPSRARYRLPDVAAVRRFLAALAARPPTPA